MLKLQGLRANAAGWRSKPFERVLVNIDRRRSDVESYARTVQRIESGATSFPMLWAGEKGYADTLPARPKRLPLTIVVDTKGRVAARHGAASHPKPGTTWRSCFPDAEPLSGR